MTPNNAPITVVGCFSVMLLLFAAGVWFYLLYNILAATHASSAMWSAYWVYVPMELIGSAGVHLYNLLTREPRDA